jgi:glycosyltransferase involved in cell wall biosynthesis
MKNSIPEQSVIMATYNENSRFLKTCIDSILHQTFQDFEFIIVVEPGEKNVELLEELKIKNNRVKILRNESWLGVAASRNRAIKESSGKYIAIVDGDDYCDLKRFEKQIRFLESHPEVNVVGSNMFLVDENDKIFGERRYPEIHKDIKKAFLLTMAVANPAVMMRRRDIEEVGFFDNNFYKAEDFELWLRFLANKKIMHNLQENLVYYRIPSNHNEKRHSIHWKNNFIARKRYSKFIWPFYRRLFSMSFYYITSKIPDRFLNDLFNIQIVNRIRNIRMN